ncbi:TonB-dependent receptor [Sediminibacterium sp.]|uniref:TonB-dependent receptor n=1 Tax=Sediminibacterium sp. TaxID=1917865 RepID=UPI00273621D1|nr:TonB-dependent receptor [Sediminibacterium sp.]MDP3394518.1 TonB-dependent receptor [Sediminibacterium sp.]MDP3568353.1 TonB-dependent receptor [Sediminibacterium sp.]
MKKLFVILVLALVQVTAMAQGTKTTGRITDAATGMPLEGASVTIKSTGMGTSTDVNGKFSLLSAKSGKITLRISYVGYADVEKVVEAGAAIDITLKEEQGRGNDVVVSASKRPEKITRAPATISVISAKDLEQTSSFNIGELASKIQGVEFIRTGVNGVGFNARGFNNAFNAKILQMTDGRNSMMAGGSGLPSGIMNTVIKEDVERLEIVLGPNSALYGPNAHNGIANTITKDPRKHQGTTLVIGAGNRDVFSGRFRTASKINNKWAYKITGEYTTGRDFEFNDSIYAGGSVYGPALAIPERIPNYNFKHVRGAADVYYAVNAKSDIIVSYGGSNNNFLSVNNTGRNQIKDWKFSYLQVKYVSPRFFAQAYETWTNVGNSYGIPGYTRDYWNRTHSTITDPANPLFAAVGQLYPDQAEAFATRLGNRFKETSKRFNAEAQYNNNFEKAGLSLVVGMSYQKDKPNTYGTSLIDANQLVEVTQYGGAIQLEKTLPADFKLVAAARLDHHSLFKNMFSPKLALVKGVPGGSVRLTYGKAFAAPIILFQRASVFGLVFGNGDGINYVPNGAPLTTTANTVPLQPEQINTWEFGYKGTVGKKLYVDINGYYSNSKNFLSPAITVGGRALSVGSIPITTPLLLPGAVTGGVLGGAAFSTYFNYGEVASYGVDLGLNYYFNDNVSWAFKYSWFGSDITKNNIKNDANRDGYVSLEERSLNAPANRFSTTLSFQNMAKGKMFLNISMRWVESYDLYSGNQIGTKVGAGSRGVVYGGINPLNNLPRNYVKNFNWGALGGFTTFDISTGVKLNSQLSIGAGISNVFNVKQLEFVGSPSIGRLFSVELKAHIPNSKK